MQAFTIQRYNQQFVVSGGNGNYRIDTEFDVTSQPDWYLAIQNNFRVTQVHRESAGKVTIYFSYPASQEYCLMERMEDYANMYIK